MSKNYKCDDCGWEFDTPSAFTETHGLDAQPYETSYGCPACGGDYSANTGVCEICGREETIGELYDNERICSKCIDEADEGYTEALGRRFLLQAKGKEEEFYIGYAAGIQNHDCDKSRLVAIFKANEDIIIDFSDKLQAFCLESKRAEWWEFYYSVAAKLAVA